MLIKHQSLKPLQAINLASRSTLMMRCLEKLMTILSSLLNDGKSITLSDFYVNYTSENLPDFFIEGTLIDGEAFFAALGDELQPAAGSAASMDASGGDSVNALADGLEDLDVLSGAPFLTIGCYIENTI